MPAPKQLAKRARHGLALLPALFGIPCMTIVQRVMTAEGHVFANLAICAAVFATPRPGESSRLPPRSGLRGRGVGVLHHEQPIFITPEPYCIYTPGPRSAAIREVFDRRGIREFLGLSLPGVGRESAGVVVDGICHCAGRTWRSPAVLAAVVCGFNVQTVLEM